MFTFAGVQGEWHAVPAKGIWLALSKKKECSGGKRGEEVMDWSPRRTQNCHADPGWDWELHADIWGRRLFPFKNYHLCPISQQRSHENNIVSWCLTPKGHTSGLPGNVHSVWLCGALLFCISPGGHVRSYQQHNRDPQRRPEALYWPAETLRTEGGEHWTMAGQYIVLWKMSGKPSRPRHTVGHLMRWDCTYLSLSYSLSVHIYQTAMEAMGLIAIIVNCYLIGQCGQLQRLFPWLSPEMTIISIVLLEVCFCIVFSKCRFVHEELCSFKRL